MQLTSSTDSATGQDKKQYDAAKDVNWLTVKADLMDLLTAKEAPIKTEWLCLRLGVGHRGLQNALNELTKEGRISNVSLNKEVLVDYSV